MSSIVTHLWEILFGKSELRTSRRARTLRLALERLEERIQLSGYYWVGDSGNHLASNPLNWENLTADGSGYQRATQTPGADDFIVFDPQRLGNGTPVNDCTLDANFTGTITALYVLDSYTGGTITLQKDLLVTEEAQINTGTVTGPGALDIGDSPPLGQPFYDATLSWSAGTLGGGTGQDLPNVPILVIGT